MSYEAKFLRSDGMEISAEVGSASFALMEKDGGFERLWPEGAKPDTQAKKKSEDLDGMSLKQLQDVAVLREVPVTAKMKKAEVLAALKAAEAEETEETEEV